MITESMLAKKNRLIPGRISVSLTPVVKRVEGSPVTVDNCEKRPVSQKTARNSQIAITTDHFELILSEGDLGGTIPQVNDVVTLPGGDKARIVDISREMLETRHRCLCHPHLG